MMLGKLELEITFVQRVSPVNRRYQGRTSVGRSTISCMVRQGETARGTKDYVGSVPTEESKARHRSDNSRRD